MGLVLQFGWLGETGASTPWLSPDRFCFGGRPTPRGRPLAAWCGGYGLAALGMLTKGPQAPVYFLGGVAVFLLLSAAGATCCVGSIS